MPSAGDVERFAYCAHNWALARKGIDPGSEGSRRGVKQHRSLEDAHARVERQLRDERDGMRWSFRILGAAGSVTFLTLELLYLRAHPLHWVFLLTALVLLSASSALLVIALQAQRDTERVRQQSHLIPAGLEAAGLAGSGLSLEDPEWDITGTPDLLLHTRDGVVPVEVKSGHTPRRPYRSHVLQLACYLRLLETRDGAPPPYGLIQYPDGVFRIEWDDTLRTDLRKTLDRIHQAEATGQADRDHDHAARCKGCARRSACEQALA